MSKSRKPIRVALVDDHSVLRETVAAQIDAEPGMRVILQAANADDAVTQVIAKKPDVVLMDIDMPGLSAFSAAGYISTETPDSRVIFLSGFHHDIYIEQALKSKSWGYVTKSEPFSVLRQAILDVAGGWVHYSSEVRDRIVSAPDGPRLALEERSVTSSLTPRELETLQYLARGMSSKEIARVMRISSKTVDNHKTSLMSKLGIHDRVNLAHFAIRAGLAVP
ncbi:MAG: response regulator transcription factor [Planctomycetes bacterium]|nr:response regulator transcription factor [Planctomycetota bacterium]